MSVASHFLPKRHEGDKLLPAVIAVMVFLASLSLMGSMVLGQGLDQWTASLSDKLTVQIVHADPTERKRQTEAALRLLNATPGIKNASLLAEKEVLELISPWLGDIPLNNDLPLPNLIDITLVEQGSVNPASLNEKLKATAPGAALDDHQAWLGQILTLVALLRSLFAGVTVLVLLSTIATVIFGSRAGLAAHRETISIVHLLGAEDATISQAYERRYFMHGLKGGLSGIIMAAGVLWAIGNAAQSMSGGLITALTPQEPAIGWLLLVAAGAAVVAMLTARTTVRSSLRATL